MSSIESELDRHRDQSMLAAPKVDVCAPMPLRYASMMFVSERHIAA